MTHKILSFVCVLLLALLTPLGAGAQGAAVALLPGTVAVGPEVAQALTAWLEQNRPAETHLYAPTALSYQDGAYLVSLVGLRPDLPPPYAWHFTDAEDVLWLGTVTFDGFGVEPLTLHHQKVASPAGGGPGGGGDIAFPWDGGKYMIYGTRAIHGNGDYATVGMYAVDWVGGDDIANSAPPVVRASAAGSIDWVCTDGTSAAVRVTNGSDVFVYAHLKGSYTVGTSYTKRGTIGSLVYGSFDDSCGWASQQDDHYHVHWMFTPANGFYQTEGWLLHFSDKKWHNADNQTCATNCAMKAGGSGSTPPGGDPGPGGEPGDDSGIIDTPEPLTGAYAYDYLIDAIKAGANTVIPILAGESSYSDSGGGDTGGVGDPPPPSAAQSMNVRINLLASKPYIRDMIQTSHLFFEALPMIGSMVLWVIVFLLIAFLEVLNFFWAIIGFIRKLKQTIAF